jgi:chromosome partitioning protein
MIFAIYNPNGGVGKTTTAVNVAAVLARMGRSVLLVDLQPDMNASISVGVRPSDSRPSMEDVLLNRHAAADAVRPVAAIRNLHLLTGAPGLMHMDDSLKHVRQPERRLADAIRPLASTFDAIVLDSPAGYSRLSHSVPLAADHLVVPIRADYLSLESLAHFLRWYRDRRATGKATANVAGILLTHVDHRRQATREIIEIIRAHNRRGVFTVEIPEDPRAAEAPSHGIPLVAYAPRSKASTAYRRFTDELLARIARRRR